MPRSLLTALAILAALALAACSGDTPDATPTTEVPPAAATPEATATIEATPTLPTRATPAPTLVEPPVELIDGLPAGVVGPLIVYGSHLRQLSTSDRSWPIREVVTYDVGAGEAVASFEVGAVGSQLSQVLLVGREVLVNLEHSLLVYALNGELLRTLREAPGDDGANPYGRLGRMTVSADGRYIAITEQAPHEVRDRGSLVVIEADTGAELLRVAPDDPRFAGHAVLWMEPSVWRDDGRGLLVAAVTSYEGPAQIATLFLDGTLTRHETSGWSRAAPNGRRLMHGPQTAADCMAIAGHRIVIDDLDRRETIATYEDRDFTFLAWAWSPAADQLLVQTRPFPSDPEEIETCEWGFSEPAWAVFAVDTGLLTAADPVDVMNEWHGDRAVTFRCEGAERVGVTIRPSQILFRPDECSQNDDAPAEILVNGTSIGIGATPHVLGWIEVSSASLGGDE